MEFRPEFTAFTLAGMPHKDEDRACRVMLCNFPQVPTVPWLTMSTRMYLEGMPCLNIDRERKVISFDLSPARESELVEFYDRYFLQDLDYFATSPKYNAVLYRLAEILGEMQSPGVAFVHFQIPGPYTFGLQIKDESGAPCFYNNDMRDLVVNQLAMKAKWYMREIRRVFSGAPVLIQLGEPALGVYGSATGTGSWEEIQGALDKVMEAVRSDGGMSSVHCCANFDWSLLMKTSADVIHFDAYHYGETMSLYTEALRRFLGRGGTIAWGIVPTTGGTTGKADVEDEDPRKLIKRLEGYMELVVERGVDKEVLARSSWISSSCETATLSTELAERVFELTSQVSRQMKEQHLFP